MSRRAGVAKNERGLANPSRKLTSPHHRLDFELAHACWINQLTQVLLSRRPVLDRQNKGQQFTSGAEPDQTNRGMNHSSEKNKQTIHANHIGAIPLWTTQRQV
jgi:hypothetical protein